MPQTLSEYTVEDFRQGKETAIKLLYDSFFAPLCAYGSRYLYDDAVVVDIVQDVFIALWGKRKDFFSLPSIRSFIYTSVRNACLNEIRQKKRYPTESLTETLFTHHDKDFIEEEVHRMIYQEIKQLPDAMREVFEMTLLDMSIAEIAAALQISEHTVRNQRASARKKLREKLQRWVFLLFF